jgi:hypothetical protein
MNGPPVKTKRGGRFRTTPSNFGLLDHSHIVCGAQLRWSAEADRLLTLFERSGDMRHFRALGRHLRGMRERGVAL